MSNELVYGDPTKFVRDLTASEQEAREFFDEAVTYLSACVKTLRGYRESVAETTPIPADAWNVKVEESDGMFRLTSHYASLTLVRSRPLGTVRFLITESADESSPFIPRSAEGYIAFPGETPKENQKKKAPGIFVTSGYLLPYKTDAAATFAEPLFAQLFTPLPVEPPVTRNTETKF